ncbi:MAG: transposase family protein [Myxococcales bacterium]|nr:transposase family protein [Myxococcales bacterium]
MARATKAQKLEIENEQAALQFFERMLAGLTDPRRPQGLSYPLRSVVVIALMSMVCSCDNAESMELWGELNEEWLGEILELPHGVPSQDVYLSVFASLNPSAFSEVFRVECMGCAQTRQEEFAHHHRWQNQSPPKGCRQWNRVRLFTGTS